MMLLVCASSCLHSQEVGEPATESQILAFERIGKLQAFRRKDISTLDFMLDEGYMARRLHALNIPSTVDYMQAFRGGMPS